MNFNSLRGLVSEETRHEILVFDNSRQLSDAIPDAPPLNESTIALLWAVVKIEKLSEENKELKARIESLEKVARELSTRTFGLMRF